MLLDERFGCTLCKFRAGAGASNLKVIRICVLEGGDVLLNGRIRQMFAARIIHIEIHQILFLGSTGVAGLYINIEVGSAFRYCEFAADILPFSLCSSFRGDGVIIFLAV